MGNWKNGKLILGGQKNGKLETGRPEGEKQQKPGTFDSLKKSWWHARKKCGRLGAQTTRKNEQVSKKENWKVSRKEDKKVQKAGHGRQKPRGEVLGDDKL